MAEASVALQREAYLDDAVPVVVELQYALGLSLQVLVIPCLPVDFYDGN
eukprot:CAMPEP_0119416370 /NCGR_PEP_ID=MMETSP1335-20130426/12797_1 /TAXON_ID=259385 /ORGANISM="Chrysoculter rhomboideus, Strain RCC1486" /LENGTH=48 /DNA_ID= /DNA_START= /DNA_END= /DNA_ORIENTATION=